MAVMVRTMNRKVEKLVARRRRRRYRPLMSALLVIVCASAWLLAVSGAGTAAEVERAFGRTGASAVPKWVAEIPLWRFVPVRDHRFAVLEEGVSRQMRWGLYAFRGHGVDPGQKPCLELVTLYFGGGQRAVSVHNGASCGPLAPPAVSPVAIQSGFKVEKQIHGPFVSSNAAGLTFGLNVRHVSLTLVPGPSRGYATKVLSRVQAEKANIEPFRFVAFGVAHDLCIAGIEGFDEAGVQVLTSSGGGC